MTRFRRPTARVALGQAVATLASAAIDVSDGLAADLLKLLAASGVGATVELESLPLSAALLGHAGRDEALRLALAGGDDYELCMTVPDDAEARFLQAAADCGVAVTRIGTVAIEPGLRFTRAGTPVELDFPGYDHF
ncbi:MAG: AIR synthase-related protein [Woeseiaceae bacterium]|nr:AIR synthase-related protein [Woeseiaceae bacterium]